MKYNNPFALALAICLSTIIIWLTWIIINSFQIKVDDYYPKEKLEANDSALMYQLNRKVKIEDLKLVASPELLGTFRYDNNLKYYFQPKSEFAPNQSFSITVFHKNRQILAHSFTAPNISSSQEPLIQNDLDILARYPLIRFFPYEDENMVLNYVKPLTLSVVPKKTNVDVIKLAKEFMLDHNVDPKTHSIIIK